MHWRVTWIVIPLAVACSSDEQAASTTPDDVVQSCIAACSKQTACVPPAPLIDCNTVCGLGAPLDGGVGCHLNAQKARYDQCGLLECVNIGSCVVDVGVSCRGVGGAPPSTGGAPSSGGAAGATGGGGAGATGGTAGATGGASGADCVACTAKTH